jgi:hypothetical protein
MTQEQRILAAMAKGSPSEQRALAADLAKVRLARVQALSEERSLDLDAEIAQTLRPVAVRTMHTASTDWLGDMAPSYSSADRQKVAAAMKTEASLWFKRVSPAVREDRGEFVAQARGMARHVASQYGDMIDDAQGAFISHVALLFKLAEGTDMVGTPSATDSDGNPNLDDWAKEPAPIEGTGESLAPDSYDAPPGVSAGESAPAPDSSGGGGDHGTNSDGGPSKLDGDASGGTQHDPMDVTGGLLSRRASMFLASDDDGDIDDRFDWDGSKEDIDPNTTEPREKGEPKESRRHHALDNDTRSSDDEEEPEEPYGHRETDIARRGRERWKRIHHPDRDESGKFTSMRHQATTPPCGNSEKHGRHTYGKYNSICNGTPNENTVWTADKGWADGKKESFRRHAEDVKNPGEVDPEQDGEAKSTLPYEISKDRMGQDNPFANGPVAGGSAPVKDAPSTRAPNVKASVLVPGPNPFLAGRKQADQFTVENNTGEQEDGPFDDMKTAEDDIKGQFGGGASGEHVHQSRRHAVSTAPNPYGSKVYDPAAVTDIGYKEGFAYAVSWSPGRPLPAAMSSAVAIGAKYQSQYVDGYKAGMADGIATLPSKAQGVFAAEAQKQMILAIRRIADSNTRQLDELDQTPSTPWDLSEDGSAPDGAAKGTIPTPEQNNGYEPRPEQGWNHPGESSIGGGNYDLDAWFSGGDDN